MMLIIIYLKKIFSVAPVNMANTLINTTKEKSQMVINNIKIKKYKTFE